MDKLSFLKEHFKKGNLVVYVSGIKSRWMICELLETYKEGFEWLDVERYYKNGIFSPLITELHFRNRFLEETGTNLYVVIKEFYYD